MIAAICTNRPPAAVRAALAAACEQAAGRDDAEALLVTSGLEADERTAHSELAARFGARVAAAGAGISVARNRALEEAADEDVVAFLDDDAVPGPGWLSNLAAHWAEAPAEVACIGGAIDPDWQSPPPAWVSGRLAGAFSLLDLGPEVVELDPAAGSDAWGANVSFRAGPLREVGGFDPDRGAWGGWPLFGDESAVQRRLGERGYRVLYAGDVRVKHRVDAERLRLRSLWRREYFRGVSAGGESRLGPAAGAASAAKATAGLAVAMARRDPAQAGERFARVARGAGSALRPLARRRLRAGGWPG